MNHHDGKQCISRTIMIASMVIFLAACNSITPSPIPASSPAAIPTKIFLPTETSTPTLPPTITATPGLPATVNIQIDEKIPANIADLAKNTVRQAYLVYIDLGCSPDFYHARFVGYESAGADVDGIVIGWNDLTQITSNMDVRISHEMVHAMCQLAVTGDPNTGAELEWLLEGMANYFSDNERLIDVGGVSGVPGNLLDHQRGMAEWVRNSKYCTYPFKAIEKDIPPFGTGAWARPYPDAGGVGAVAAALLANTSPGGAMSLLNYYRHLKTEDIDTAFENAFGRTRDEFYQQFADECARGFPTLNVLAEPFDLILAQRPPLPTRTPFATPTLEAGYVPIQGNIVLSSQGGVFSDYVISFCDVVTSECLPGFQVQGDGTFSGGIKPGKYKVRVNSINGGDSLGIYTKQGLVNDWKCAEVVWVYRNQELALTIDLTPTACPT
jgi:hypothetical protein